MAVNREALVYDYIEWNILRRNRELINPIEYAVGKAIFEHRNMHKALLSDTCPEHIRSTYEAMYYNSVPTYQQYLPTRTS